VLIGTHFFSFLLLHPWLAPQEELSTNGQRVFRKIFSKVLPKSNQNPNVTIGNIFQKKGTLDRILPFSFSFFDFGKLPHYNQNAD
jgi:hypothetical protein